MDTVNDNKIISGGVADEEVIVVDTPVTEFVANTEPPVVLKPTHQCEKLKSQSCLDECETLHPAEPCPNTTHLRTCSRCQELYCHVHASLIYPLVHCIECAPTMPQIIDETFERIDKLEDWNEETDEVVVEYVKKYCRKITFKNPVTGEFFSKFIHERSDKELEHDVIRWQAWIKLAEDEILKRRTELAKQYAAKTGTWPIGHKVPNYPDYALKPTFRNKTTTTSTTTSPVGTKTTTTTRTVTKGLRGAKTTSLQTYNVRQIMDEIKALGQMADKEQAMAELLRLQELLTKAKQMSVNVKAGTK